MKVNLGTIARLNEHYGCAGDVLAIGTGKLIEKIGTQLGSVDEVIDFGAKYNGAVIVKVVSCVKHPNADKLSVCRIDDGGAVKDVERGEDGLIQVVCGAPNVREGLIVVWLPPGSTVPATYGKEPLVLEVREIRGQKSNGMLASPKELALGDSHDGILEIDYEYDPGSDFAETFIFKDVILDIENKMFTHRPDCFGFLGIGRELAGIQNMPFKSPDWYVPSPQFTGAGTETLALKVSNELPELVPRFTVMTMSGVEIGPSPLWLQIELAKLGLKSINNVVDYTNFYMLETGQPLHAYDYDKVKALSGGEASIVIRNPKPGEKIKLLNGKEIEPRAEAIMIATAKQLIGVGGVMGGSQTEVDENTKNIILECANFDMYSVRRTSMEHGLFTDAATRFTKGQSPLQNLAVLAKIVDEIRQHAGGKVAGQVIDDNHLDETVLTRNSLFPPVKLSADFINSRLGLKLTAEEMKQILENVEFKVELEADDLTVTAPFWRTDIELREDVVEEVGRLYGYDHLPLELPRRDLTPAPKDQLLTLKTQIRATLAKAGANEVLTYSFVHGQLLKKVGQDPAKAFRVSNALSPDLQYYRLSLTPSLLDKIHANLKAGYDQFALFELGKSHLIGLEDDGIPLELERLGLIFATAQQPSMVAYYMARKYLMSLLDSLKIADRVRFEPLNPVKYAEDTEHKIPYYEPGRSATILLDDVVLGEIGEYKSAVRQALKLPEHTAGFELDVSVLLSNAAQLNYVTLSNFPKVIQDITLKVPADLPYQDLFDGVSAELNKVKPVNSLAELTPVDIYQKDESRKNVTLRLKIASYERTLTDAEVNKLLDEVATTTKQKFGAERV